jgi:hypothetical protein
MRAKNLLQAQDWADEPPCQIRMNTSTKSASCFSIVSTHYTEFHFSKERRA